MSPDPLSPLDVATLIELAKTGAAWAMPPETRQSYPIPLRDGRLNVGFLYSPQGLLSPVEGLHLLTPTHLANLDAISGALRGISRVVPSQWGQKHALGEDIGIHAMPEGMNLQSFNVREEELFHSYDILMPAFAARQTTVQEPVREASRRFCELFPLLSEGPLHPYYYAIGFDFFEWVRGIAL